MKGRRTLTLFALLVLALSFGCDDDDEPDGVSGATQTDQDLVNQGQALYQPHCEDCHGADGSGAPEYPWSIQGARGISEIVLKGADEMPSTQLTSDEIEAIEAFLAAQ